MPTFVWKRLYALTAGVPWMLLLPLSARADESEAERLFREGRALMLEGRFEEACPKIAESQRLEPHTGTLLNLAACHEKHGKVGAAWIEYQKALTAARAEGQTDRERLALERVTVLEPRVPWLTVSVANPAEQPTITLDGATLPPLEWGKELPVDPGAHVVAANAPSRAPFEEHFELAEGERRTVTVLLAEQAATPLPVAEPTPEPVRPKFVPAYGAIFHPLATNFDDPYVKTRFGVNLLYGRAGELDNGVQIGLVNVIAGKPGIASGNMSGVQLAPLFGFNYASGRASGLQIGYIANAAGGGLEGAQIAFGANVAAGPTTGVQAALLANVAADDVAGFQLSSVNIARGVRGAQVGFVNVAKKIEGLALGLVNVADDIDGVPIGFVSVTRTGGVHPIVWAGSATYANAGVKFATKHTYTLVAAHYTNLPREDAMTDGGRPLHFDEHEAIGGGFFFGGHVPIDNAFVDFDLGFSGMGAPSRSVQTSADGTQRSYHELVLEPRLRVLAGYSLAEHASFFFGGSMVVRARIDGRDAVVHGIPELFGGLQF